MRSFHYVLLIQRVSKKFLMERSSVFFQRKIAPSLHSKKKKRGTAGRSGAKDVVVTTCKDGKFMSRLVHPAQNKRSKYPDSSLALAARLRDCSVNLGRDIKTEYRHSRDSELDEDSDQSLYVKDEHLSSDVEDTVEEIEKNRALKAEERRLRRGQMVKELNPDSDVGEEDVEDKKYSGPQHDHTYTNIEGPKYAISSDSEVDIETCDEDKQKPGNAKNSLVYGVNLDGLASKFIEGPFKKKTFQASNQRAGRKFVCCKVVDKTYIQRFLLIRIIQSCLDIGRWSGDTKCHRHRIAVESHYMWRPF